MTFLSPAAFALLALIPPIIALYLLKLRRQDYEISSVYLWQRFVRDVEANAPWQRLRRNLLLLLQILFMLLLILALARPTTEAEGVAGQSVALLLDNSASMGAVDIEGGFGRKISRLAAAQETARDLAANLPAEARLTVIAAAGGQAELLLSASRDRRQALRAISAIEPTALDSDLTPALALAEAIVARESAAEIVLLSDGAIQLPRTAAPLRFIPVGQSGNNQAIGAFSVTENGQSLFVQVRNYSRRSAERRLVIDVDGAPFTAFDLELPAGGHAERVVETLPPAAETVEAYLVPDEADLLTLDDRAWRVVRAARPAPVTLVTEGNFFLQTALNLLDGQHAAVNVDLSLVAPEDWTATDQLHIFDGYVPETLPPGNLLFIGPPASVPSLFEVAGQLSQPDLTVTLPDHPLGRQTALAEVQILQAAVLIPGDWARTVAAAGDGAPLLLAGEVAGRRVAVLAFDLRQSDLPLRPAFPIFIANLVAYLAPEAGGLLSTELAPGQAAVFAAPPEVEGIRLIPPDGEAQRFEPEAGRISLPPLARPGLYQLALEPSGESAWLAVNFFDPAESGLAPRPDLALGGAGPESRPEAAAPARREWWRWLALGAVALLVVEWLVYRRSAVMNLIGAGRRRMGA